MTGQKLDRTLTCYRIGDPAGEFPIFSAAGARLVPGRWHGIEHPLIYAAEHLSLAMLEALANGRGRIPENQHWISITLPVGLAYEVIDAAQLPGWDAAKPLAAQAHGARWVAQKRSPILFVPSAVCRTEQNVLINPQHDDFPRIQPSLHRPVIWDRRLFGG